MQDQSKDASSEKNNPGQATQNPGQNKPEHEGAFSHQSGKDIQQPQKKDVQNSDQDNEQKTGTNR